eukprot:COSAG06_NODE_18408_length_889_cov_1.179747_1_plen_53_part_01
MAANSLTATHAAAQRRSRRSATPLAVEFLRLIIPDSNRRSHMAPPAQSFAAAA